MIDWSELIIDWSIQWLISHTIDWLVQLFIFTDQVLGVSPISHSLRWNRLASSWTKLNLDWKRKCRFTHIFFFFQTLSILTIILFTLLLSSQTGKCDVMTSSVNIIVISSRLRWLNFVKLCQSRKHANFSQLVNNEGIMKYRKCSFLGLSGWFTMEVQYLSF